jgi:hypothetical protein
MSVHAARRYDQNSKAAGALALLTLAIPAESPTISLARNTPNVFRSFESPCYGFVSLFQQVTE